MVCSPSVSSECSQLEARGRGTSQLSKRLQDMITFHTMHEKKTPPSPLQTLLCLFSAVSLKPRSSLSLFLPFLPSPFLLEIRPRADRTQILSDLWYTQHFLSGLWRPALSPINTAVIYSGGGKLWALLKRYAQFR